MSWNNGVNWLYILIQGVPLMIIVFAGLLRIERRLTRVETILEMIKNNGIAKGGAK